MRWRFSVWRSRVTDIGWISGFIVLIRFSGMLVCLFKKYFSLEGFSVYVCFFLFIGKGDDF